MLDRASTFTQPTLLRMLRERLIPVAIDQAYQRRQKDAEGEFYRRIASQSPRNDFGRTTQGFYLATAKGELLLYNNNRDPKKLARLVTRALDAHQPDEAEPIASGKPDPRWNPRPPKDGLVLRVHSRVLGGYPEPKNRWHRILYTAMGRDNMWITAAEHRALTKDELPASLLRRLARFHLIDNTRGEPPMWRKDEILSLDVKRQGKRISGTVKLRSKDGKRSFEAQLLGQLDCADGKVKAFELIAAGQFEGEGRYTPRAPKGRFPLAIRFSLADGKMLGDTIPPQGSRGWLGGYLR